MSFGGSDNDRNTGNFNYKPQEKVTLLKVDEQIIRQTKMMALQKNFNFGTDYLRSPLGSNDLNSGLQSKLSLNPAEDSDE